MKKKMILLAAVILLALAVVICIALFSESGTQKGEEEAGTPSTDQTDPTDESQSSEDLSAENLPAPVYKEGMFTFNASQFHQRFADTLPEGYILADVVAANSSRNNKMQIDILDAAGEPTDMGILLDVKEPELPCHQMALVIKEDWYEEDVAAMLEWYLSTFLDDLDEEEQALICEDYLDMFCSRAEEYRLYTEDSYVAMMTYGTEDSGNYYYVMISIQ